MAKLNNYSGSVDLISGLRPKNNGAFPLLTAHDVQVDENGKRLDAILAEIAGTPLHYSTEINPITQSDGFVFLKKEYCSSDNIQRDELIIYSGGLCKQFGFSDTEYVCQRLVEYSSGGSSITITDISESTESGGDNVVTFSDGKTLTVKNGKDGEDYVLTPADKQDIAELVENVTFYERPTIVSSVDEMTDTSKQYVLKSTGTIWEYKSATVEQEVTVTDTIEGTTDNPYVDGNRFSSSTASDTFSNDATGYHLTPLIDLTKEEYQGKTIELHLEGVQYASTGVYAQWIQTRVYGTDKSVLNARTYTCDTAVQGAYLMFDVSGITVTYNNETSATLTIDIPPTVNSSAAPKVGYLRFTGKGAIANSNIYIKYTNTQTVTGYQWVDTGLKYNGTSSGVDEETLAKISALNNEGVSPSTIKLLPKPVLDFYNASAYSDSDYTKSHLSKITYPCRADIPVPFTVKWEYNENAMRTTVAVDTKTIGTVNAYTLLTYDVTGLNKYPLYNLLPNTRYYYKVTHIMADGSIVEAKSGTFITSTESIRLMYIDGTQNVRDLGGWSGLNGKKVKYGKIFRGAAFSDTSYPELVLTGKGKRALGELKVQAELNLGAADTETSISATCSYHKIGYSNYAAAITDATARANFKAALEKIVSWLSEATPRNIYMHCQGGCDRTGTLAFQLLGLLGVSESDLAKEYELSSFSSIGIGRLRTTTKAVDVYDYVGMVEALKTYSGTTITEKFYNFAIACGVSADTITSFRNLMLG